MEKEILEKAAENYSKIILNKDGLMSNKQINGFIAGAKWQQERSYSEEEVFKLVDGAFHMYASSHRHDAKEWLVEQFKKK
jgi:hypothetical protein